MKLKQPFSFHVTLYTHQGRVWSGLGATRTTILSSFISTLPLACARSFAKSTPYSHWVGICPFPLSSSRTLNFQINIFSSDSKSNQRPMWISAVAPNKDSITCSEKSSPYILSRRVSVTSAVPKIRRLPYVRGWFSRFTAKDSGLWDLADECWHGRAMED